MGTTLSPFRYLQIARYIVHKWIDHIPTVKGKGRARTTIPVHRQAPLLRATAATSSAAESKPSPQSSDDDIPVAGPSRLRDEAQDDPKQKSGHQHRHPPSHRRFPKLAPDPKWPAGPTDIYGLMNDERLLIPGAAKPPRETVVLCHGLYGFSTATPIPLFPSLKLHYWASVLEVLRDRMGVDVVVVGVKGTGSIQERAEQMHEFLKNTLPRGTGVNFVAHSMGGLDCRYLISHLKPTTYTPVSLTTIGTPHRGSPFMDWCAANIGVGSAAAVANATAALTGSGSKALPFSLKSPLLARPPQPENGKQRKVDAIGSLAAGLTSYLLSIFDSPAYSNLTTSFLRDHFNPNTPDVDTVKYTSVAGRCSKMSVLHPLWFPKLVLDAAAENGYAEDSSNFITGPDGKRIYEGNDGLVSVSSAKWGEYLGAVDECHHWDLRGEGGLFPNGAISGMKKEGKADESMPGGWEDDGKGGSMGRHGAYEHLGLSSDPKVAERQIADYKKSSGKAGTPPKPSSSSTSLADWDLAQVGQVMDWVTDFIPGAKSTETGKRQLAEAQREKDKEVEERKEAEKEKKKREKFDLARFYGGLMVKLRDDGY
ncbi:hypothetical protein CI109_104663 [Kwoniella shandongensis]|uniref:Uncharacterized protein n=1 Tax=Kwoniella shandongensis TaxID=1734106 RepID=A0A5M6C0U6_9TREE|nr:uncharacterized protein CI109_004829 [Kwoniella shandongensis]KAA5526829.1 hypothetical protein CI109_004829 [Kwoniella shandongensis]